MHRAERAHQPGPRLTCGAHIARGADLTCAARTARRSRRTRGPHVLDPRPRSGCVLRVACTPLFDAGTPRSPARGRAHACRARVQCSVGRCGEAPGRRGRRQEFSAALARMRPHIRAAHEAEGTGGAGGGTVRRDRADSEQRRYRTKHIYSAVMKASSWHPVVGGMVAVHTRTQGLVVPEQPGASLALDGLSVDRGPLATTRQVYEAPSGLSCSATSRRSGDGRDDQLQQDPQ